MGTKSMIGIPYSGSLKKVRNSNPVKAAARALGTEDGFFQRSIVPHVVVSTKTPT